VIVVAAIYADGRINLFFTVLFLIFQVSGEIAQGFGKISARAILADVAKTCRYRIKL
jgi:hypothetical protein